jgi:NADH dehydrogenase (ubiquinone) 1 beta subcomplex subunit 9
LKHPIQSVVVIRCDNRSIFIMNKSFTAVVNTFKPVVKLQHNIEVMRMYRKCLRTITSWCESREVFNYAATEVRQRFDANKNITEKALYDRIVREAHEELAAQTHADPVIAAYMPGGSLFMRNPSLPYEIIYPDGIPEGVSTRRLNIDMSYVPDGQPWADKCFVDSANKLYWIDK